MNGGVIMKELKYLLSLSGKHRIKLIFSAIFSIIGTTLSAVPYLLVYKVVLELFKTNIDYFINMNFQEFFDWVSDMGEILEKQSKF